MLNKEQTIKKEDRKSKMEVKTQSGEGKKQLKQIE